MAHFAQIDSDNIVTQVIVVNNEDCLDSDGNESEAVGVAFCQDLLGADTNWVQTSYNNNMRFTYAGIGNIYLADQNVFLPQKPFPSWVLNTSTWVWDAPVALPSDHGINNDKVVMYDWDEDSTSWTNRQEINHFTTPSDLGMSSDESYFVTYDFNLEVGYYNRQEIKSEET